MIVPLLTVSMAAVMTRSMTMGVPVILAGRAKTVMKVSIEDPCCNDSVCYQRLCCKIKFGVLEKLDMDLFKA